MGKHKKLTMTEEQLEAVVAMQLARYSEFQTEAFICVLSRSLNEEYGFGRERILRLLKRIYIGLEAIGDNPELLTEHKAILENKFGIKIADKEWEA